MSYTAIMDKSVEPSSTDTPERPPRTPGLKLFDVFLYPVLTNTGVFLISVAATYLTARGGDRNAQGQLKWGKVGKWFQDRGTWMMGKFKALGMNDAQADMSKMVFFSFADGSLMAPFVKMFEDRREQIGRAIDERLGTVPDDDRVYEHEPNQTWLSVLGGRLLTASIVVPTAVALDKTGLNETLFNKPGKQAGDWLTKNTSIQKWAGNVDVKEVSRVSFFEGFYTSVCTLGLYFTSRRIARARDKRNDPDEALKTPPSTDLLAASTDGEVSMEAKSHAEKHLRKTKITEQERPENMAGRYAASLAHAPATVGI